MYYSKYFEGSVPAISAAETINQTPIDREQGTTSTAYKSSTSNKLKNYIVGEAIASTLRDCGLDARYDMDTGYIYFDYVNSNIGIHCFIDGSYIRFTYSYVKEDGSLDYIQGASTSSSGESTRYSRTDVFSETSLISAADYKICITVCGDTSSMFTIYFGTYSNPTSISNVIGTFYMGVDKHLDVPVFGEYFSYPTSNLFCVYSNTLIPIKYTTSTSQSPISISPASNLSLFNNIVVLIEQYIPTVPMIAFEGVFINPGLDTSGKFYEIDGEIYYTRSNYCIKCTTQVTPTPAVIVIPE